MEPMPNTTFGCTILANKLVGDYLLLAENNVSYEVEALVENWIKHNIDNPPEGFFDVVMKEFLRLLQEKQRE